MLGDRRDTYKHTGKTTMEIMKYYQDEYHQTWFKLKVAIEKSIKKRKLLLII
jgi:hypothetical protein